MKICKSCGAPNKDDSRFCSSCGAAEFEPSAQPNIPPPPPPPAVVCGPAFQRQKPDFTMFDLCVIFGFVASLVGLFQIPLILEPLALLTSIIGFAKGKRFRGLAAAGVTVSAIGLLLRLFTALYLNGLVPNWLISGAFY